MFTILSPHLSFLGGKPSLGAGREPGASLPALVPLNNVGLKTGIRRTHKNKITALGPGFQLHFETFLLDRF